MSLGFSYNQLYRFSSKLEKDNWGEDNYTWQLDLAIVGCMKIRRKKFEYVITRWEN